MEGWKNGFAIRGTRVKGGMATRRTKFPTRRKYGVLSREWRDRKCPIVWVGGGRRDVGLFYPSIF